MDWEGERFEVRYGYDGRYEVLIVDEYVKLSETLIMEVGCEVVPGMFNSFPLTTNLQQTTENILANIY